jgi:IS5 family transposase
MVTFFEIGTEARLKDSKLLRLNKMINWKRVSNLLAKVHQRDISCAPGGQMYDKLKMFKAILLGQWHSLSDYGLEEALSLRLDFMRFTGFELADTIPDETTLCRFRNKLAERKLDKMLFKEINKQLEELGLKVEKADAAVIDATIIESAARPRRTIEIAIDREEDIDQRNEAIVNNEAESPSAFTVTESADKDAKWLKKGKKCYYGYKAFAVVEGKEGFITQTHVTSANQSETGEFTQVMSNVDAKRSLADKAYSSKVNRQYLKSRKIKSGIMYKALRNNPLTKWQKLFNKLVSKQRYIIEQTFGTLKRKFLFTRASYYGLRKVEAQLNLKSICFNLTKALNMVKCA